MKTLSKEEMITALAKICVQKKVFDYIKQDTEEDVIKYLSLSDDISTEIQDAAGEIQNYVISVVENTLESASDNEEMLIIFKIENIANTTTGYLRFRGRYSSWDASYFYDVNVVYPREVSQVQYLTKLEIGE